MPLFFLLSLNSSSRSSYLPNLQTLLSRHVPFPPPQHPCTRQRPLRLRRSSLRIASLGQGRRRFKPVQRVALVSRVSYGSRWCSEHPGRSQDGCGGARDRRTGSSSLPPRCSRRRQGPLSFMLTHPSRLHRSTAASPTPERPSTLPTRLSTTFTKPSSARPTPVSPSTKSSHTASSTASRTRFTTLAKQTSSARIPSSPSPTPPCPLPTPLSRRSRTPSSFRTSSSLVRPARTRMPVGSPPRRSLRCRLLSVLPAQMSPGLRSRC